MNADNGGWTLATALCVAMVTLIAACTATSESTATPPASTSTPEATATAEPPALLIDQFECVDIYPGVPGSVGHHATSTGMVSNDSQGQTIEASFDIIVLNSSGELIYRFESANPSLSVSPGGTARFSASGDLPLALSLEGAMCRVDFWSNDQPVAVSGSNEALVKVLYAP